MMLPSRVAIAISLHRILEPGERVLVAVSGGPDSLALLAILRELVPQLGLHLAVAHFDHGWRAESKEDARFTATVAAGWGLACIVGGPGPGERIGHSENAAR